MPVRFELEPNLIQTGIAKFRVDHYAGAKYYRAKWVQGRFVALSRKPFKRASEAERYGKQVIQRLRSLKAAAALIAIQEGTHEPEPTAAD